MLNENVWIKLTENKNRVQNKSWKKNMGGIGVGMVDRERRESVEKHVSVQ